MGKLRSSFLLFIAAVIWGITFVSQSDAMAHIEPFTFNFIRCTIGCIVLLPFISLFGRAKKKTPASGKTTVQAQGDSMPANGMTASASGAVLPAKKAFWNRKLLTGGLFCGLALFAATSLQQFGISLGDSVGKAGFVTSFYMILVPFLGIFFKKRTTWLAWLSAGTGLVGLYLLCIKPAGSAGFGIEQADLLYLGCAVFFALHIILISIYSPSLNGAALSCIQFAVTAVLSGVAMLIFEKPSIDNILKAYQPLLYAGVMSCGIAYTLQVVGQKGLEPTVASLIMCLESVVAVLAGWLLRGQGLTGREIIGCIIMLAATMLAQIPCGAKPTKREEAERTMQNT